MALTAYLAYLRKERMPYVHRCCHVFGIRPNACLIFTCYDVAMTTQHMTIETNVSMFAACVALRLLLQPASPLASR